MALAFATPCQSASPHFRASGDLEGFAAALGRSAPTTRSLGRLRRSRVVREARGPAGLAVPLVAAGAALGLGGLAALGRWVRSPDEDHSLSEHLRSGSRRRKKAPVLVCLGDSLTRGNLSASWVSLLSAKLREQGQTDTVVLNAGTNMHCAWNARQRLDEVLSCGPTHVVVLIGTNDIKAELSPIEGLPYFFMNELPRPASLRAYEEDLIAIRDGLLAAGASVAFASPPVLGEDVTSEANSLASRYAAVAKGVAEARSDRCTYLPLFERTRELAQKGPGRPYDGFRFFTWMWAMCFDVYVLRQDYADVQKNRDLGVTVDLVHLGPAAAESLADMALDFLEERPAGPSAPAEAATAVAQA